MNTRLCLTIASRIDTVLQRELGEGIDLARMLSDPLYRRDVLLVCEAEGGPELTALAAEFVAASAAADAEIAGGTRSTVSEVGFSPSRFFNSLFGALGLPTDQPPPTPGKDREQGSGRGRS